MKPSEYRSYAAVDPRLINRKPTHWNVAPLFAVAKPRNSKNVGMREDNLLSLSYGRIVRRDINTNDGLLPESFETYQIVEPGDTVFRLTDLQNDQRSLRTALVTERGIITSAYLALEPTGVLPEFFAYLARAYDQEKTFYRMGSGLRQSLKFEELRRLPVFLPPFEEQCRIAAFLDYETARIDELVHEQERLRNLVDSKRTAVIRHYVTKGVVTGVASKDSGVEWIGTVPNHWQIDRVKWSQQDVKGGVWGSEPNGDEWDIPCVRVADFDRTRGEVHTPIPTMRNIPVNERVGRVLRKGDLVLEKSGGGDSQPVGYVVLYSDSQPAVCSNFTSRIQLGDGMHPSYWRFVHRSLYSVRRNVASIKQTSGIQNLDVDAYCDELVPFPPAAEQVAIAQRIEAETYALDRLVIDVGQAIRLLLERRSALISAAVTGQLDLRDWQPPEAAAVAGVA